MKILPNQCKRNSLPVEDIEAIKPLIEEMLLLCKRPIGKKTGGLALAHCQIDHDKPLQFFVFANGDVVINPKIIERNGKFKHKEGCLSYPFREDVLVDRYNEIDVEYLDINGERREEFREGINACIFQHEIDHFNGKHIYL